MVNLCNLAPSGVLARMAIGDQVHLGVEGQRLVVENKYKESLLNHNVIGGEGETAKEVVYTEEETDNGRIEE